MFDPTELTGATGRLGTIFDHEPFGSQLRCLPGGDGA